MPDTGVLARIVQPVKFTNRSFNAPEKIIQTVLRNCALFSFGGQYVAVGPRTFAPLAVVESTTGATLRYVQLNVPNATAASRRLCVQSRI